MIEVVVGSIIFAKETILAHQVNCKGVMGSGVARTLREKYPEIFPGYHEYCVKYGVHNLGTVNIVPCHDGHIVANIFGQENYGYDSKVYTNTPALKRGLLKVKDYANEHNLSIAIPYKIGCGRGGGDWLEIMNFISANFQDIDLTIYKWEG